MGRKLLSIFVDESGILHEPESISRYYVLTLLLHDQDLNIDDHVKSLERNLDAVGIANLCFHAGPIIRANQQFEFMNWDLRRKIFSRMMAFSRKVPFVFHCLTVDKKFHPSVEAILLSLERQLAEFMTRNHDTLHNFDAVKIYYDCGQKQITQFLHGFFDQDSSLSVEYAQAVAPKRYKLFQLADLACTIKLLELKLDVEGRLSPCEQRFFGGAKKFVHDILKPMKSKEI